MNENVYQNEHVTVDHSALQSLSADVAELRQSAVQHLRAESVQASNSAFGFTTSATLELKQSAAAVAYGDFVRVQDSTVLVLLTPRVSGDMKALLTPQTAFALGAGAVVAGRVLASLFGRRRR